MWKVENMKEFEEICGKYKQILPLLLKYRLNDLNPSFFFHISFIFLRISFKFSTYYWSKSSKDAVPPRDSTLVSLIVIVQFVRNYEIYDFWQLDTHSVYTFKFPRPQNPENDNLHADFDFDITQAQIWSWIKTISLHRLTFTVLIQTTSSQKAVSVTSNRCLPKYL